MAAMQTQPIDLLFQRDRESPKHIAIVGDSMEDVWTHGEMFSSQDGCPKFVEKRMETTPGGAAGAARALNHWNSGVDLISLVDYKGKSSEAWYQIPSQTILDCRRMPIKRRYINSEGRIVWRHDLDNGYGLDANGIEEVRRLAVMALQQCPYNAVLISDYDKGFLDKKTVGIATELYKNKCVIDAKRDQFFYRVTSWGYNNAVLKGNEEWSWKWQESKLANTIITRGSQPPHVYGTRFQGDVAYKGLPVRCVNHVGAGDCFAAHLTLALAHGLSLEEAATVAHSAGRIYVQHRQGRPPWPHEIRRDMNPIGGKIIDATTLPSLRRSTPNIVFTNGVFRLVHAGHAWLLQWAKEQGQTLVVGVNDDESAARIRPGEFVLPLDERLEMIASMECVDYVVAYPEDEPSAILEELKPDLLIKGSEYQGCHVPGEDVVKEVRFAPPSPFQTHCTSLIGDIRKA